VELLLFPLMLFASFSALAVLLVSAVAVSIWALGSFLRAMFEVPLALLEYKKRRLKREALRVELNRLKRAGGGGW